MASVSRWSSAILATLFLSLAAVATADTAPASPSATLSAEESCGKCHFDNSPNAVSGKTIESKYWKRSDHKRNDVECLSCHYEHGGSAGMFRKKSPDLCIGCHKEIAKKGDYLHAPIAGGACLTCHNPHGTSARHQLVKNVSTSCVACHSPKVAKFTLAHKGIDVSTSNCVECHSAHSRNRTAKRIKPRQHMPFKSGQCGTCHKPGSSELAKPEKDLCAICHKDVVGSPEKAGHAHAAVTEGMCTQCHSPHASDAPKGLYKDKQIANSCFLCHTGVEDEVNSKYKHEPARDLNCLTCHKGHSSTQKTLLVKDSIELCKGCHKPHAHPFGKLANGKVVIDPTTNDMLTCASCHTPHGSNHNKLTHLDKNAELCTMCHKV